MSTVCVICHITSPISRNPNRPIILYTTGDLSHLLSTTYNFREIQTLQSSVICIILNTVRIILRE